ncbi:exosortase-associated protein EpsI, V-type [Sphingomonas daechungensis]|uniref:exosortase-associated protein EpsI, V-type n=1 Tax=Sphingomonas daechungensis TaxID=1176646 RepID=UPI003785104B
MSDEITFPNTSITRRKFALGLAFASVAGVAAARQPTKSIDLLGDKKLENVIPEKIGRWSFVSNSGLVVPPEDQLARALYSQLLTRTYMDEAGNGIMLLVAQSPTQSGILQIHRPEFCYTAGGYKLSPSTPHSVDIAGRAFPALSISATRDGRTEQIVYWTRIGNHMPTSWRQQRMAVAMDNLRGYIPDAVMVRVSTYGVDRPAALADVDQFIRDLMGSVTPQTQRVLFG